MTRTSRPVPSVSESRRCQQHRRTRRSKAPTHGQWGLTRISLATRRTAEPTGSAGCAAPENPGLQSGEDVKRGVVASVDDGLDDGGLDDGGLVVGGFVVGGLDEDGLGGNELLGDDGVGDGLGEPPLGPSFGSVARKVVRARRGIEGTTVRSFGLSQVTATGPAKRLGICRRSPITASTSSRVPASRMSARRCPPGSARSSAPGTQDDRGGGAESSMS